VKGLVVVRYRGKSHTGEFIINSTKGNQGGDKSNRNASPYWVELNIQQLIGMRSKSQ